MSLKSRRRSRWWKRMIRRIRESPINYFSDLFIVAMVCFWMFDIVWESIVATLVTVSSIILSFHTGMSMYETSMWSSIGSNVVLPLSAGGALWMIKNGVQHAIMNKKGKECPSDFPEYPKVDAIGADEGNEEPMFEQKESEELNNEFTGISYGTDDCVDNDNVVYGSDQDPV